MYFVSWLINLNLFTNGVWAQRRCSYRQNIWCNICHVFTDTKFVTPKHKKMCIVCIFLFSFALIHLKRSTFRSHRPFSRRITHCLVQFTITWHPTAVLEVYVHDHMDATTQQLIKSRSPWADKVHTVYIIPDTEENISHIERFSIYTRK